MKKEEKKKVGNRDTEKSNLIGFIPDLPIDNISLPKEDTFEFGGGHFGGAGASGDWTESVGDITDGIGDVAGDILGGIIDGLGSCLD